MQFRELASAELSAVADKLAAAATAEIDSTVTRVRAEAQQAIDAAVAERTEAKAAVDKAIAEHAEIQAAVDKAIAQRAEIQAALDKAVSERADALAAVDIEKAERAELTAELDDLQRQHTEAAAELDRERRQRAALTQQIKEVSASQSFADAARREAESAREKEATQRKRLEADLAAAQARAAELQRQQDAGDKEHASERRALRDRLSKEALTSLDSLRSAFSSMVRAVTADEVLTVIVDTLATEFARAAFFDVNGNRLEGRHYEGADGEGDISKLVIPLTVASPLTTAVRDGKVIGLTARELDEATIALFGGEPTFVLVLPITIRGRVMSVLYADDAGQPHGDPTAPLRGATIAEILVWHAVPLLTKLAAEYESLSDIREYAASLVANLESVYTTDAAGNNPSELRKRLQKNLEYARQQFAARVSNEPPAAARLLDAQLRSVIGTKKATPFVRDVAALIEPAAPAQKSRSKTKAEAS
jgi:hypothetical protein